MSPTRRQRNLFDSDAESPPSDPPLPEAAAPPSPKILANRANESSPDPLKALPSSGATGPHLAGKSVYVIDANSLIYQVFHALPEMTSPQGAPVSAVFGFTRDLFAILEQRQPDYLIVAFDRPEPTFRHQLYANYKGQRAETPVDLIAQLPAIREVLGAMHLPVLECVGYEADDILATIARQTESLGGMCYLVTADKDCRQLLSDHVKVLNVRKNLIFDADSLRAEWGIRPDQVVDFQALVGDAVDAIPGVPLVGPKYAADWLQKFDTLDNLLAHAEELPPGKRRDNLLAARDRVGLSRSLARLEVNVPIAFDWSQGAVRGVDRDRLARLFADFGFHNLGQKVAALPGAPPQELWNVEYQTVDTPERLAALVALLAGQPRIAIDTETTHYWPCWAELVGYSFSVRDAEAYYVPVRGPAGEQVLDHQAVLEALSPILSNPAIEKIGQNIKYDLIVLRAAGIEVRGVAFDTMVASYLLDAGERIHGIDELSERYLQHTKIKTKSLLGSGKSQRRMDEVPVAQVSEYACEDANAAWRLGPILAQRLDEAELSRLNRDVEIPLIDVLVEMESIGITVDRTRLARLSEEYGVRMQGLEREIYDLAGREFNIGSPKQLQQILFDEQKLPMVKRTKTGGSTDAEVLEELAQLHPLPAKILEYRQYAKLKGTYVDALPELIHPQTGRVHTSFNQVVAATGRLSSNDPNLQNIPVRMSQGREIRAAFVPGHPDWRLVAADYSQIELRFLAHYSHDPELLAAFAQDEDIHARVAAQVHGVALSEVTSDMRRAAKTVNFGVIYGQSAFGLAKQLRIPQDEAARFITAYFDRYQGVEAFLNQTIVECHRTGFVKTILGRRRAITGVRLDGGRQRNLAERAAINTVIQGSAADLIKLAMIAIHNRLKRENWASRLLLQIHDELIFEAPPDEIERLANMVTAEMSGVMHLDVPLKVDVKVGANWAECEVLTPQPGSDSGVA